MVRPVLLALACAALLTAVPADARVLVNLTGSRGSDPNPDDGNQVNRAQFADVSPDGAKLLFRTDEALVPADQDTRDDQYVLRDGTLELVTNRSDSNAVYGNFGFKLSDDGTKVVFTSNEPFAGDTDELTNFESDDVFRWTSPNDIQLLSGQGLGRLELRATTPSTDKVLFSTEAPLAGDSDGTARDVFLWNAQGPTLTRLSGTGSTAGGDAPGAGIGAWSEDLSKVFITTSEQLDGATPADTDAGADVYLSEGGSLRLLTGSGTNDDAANAGATPSGSHLLFMTTERLAAGDTDAFYDLYRVDVATGTITWVTPGVDGNAYAAQPAMSADGQRVVFLTNAPVAGAQGGDGDAKDDLYAFSGGQVTLLTPNTSQDVQALGGGTGATSPVYFTTNESLAATDTDTARDIYRSADGTLTHVSAGNANVTTPSFSALVSPDGSQVVYETTEAVPGAGDQNTSRDVYRWSGGAPELLTSGCATSRFGAIGEMLWSSDTLLFTGGDVPNAGDTDGATDVYSSKPGAAPAEGWCAAPPRTDPPTGDGTPPPTGGGGGGPAGPAPIAPAPPTPPRPAATTAKVPAPAAATVRGSTTVRLAGSAFTVGVANPNAYAVSVKVTAVTTRAVAAAAKRRLTLATTTATVGARREAQLKLRLGSRARTVLRRLRRVPVTLTITTTGPGGRTTSTRRVTLRSSG